MKFPLDIIWIRGGIVAGIIFGAEPEGAIAAKIYSSPEPVDRVLEINAGEASKWGIRPGDLVAY